MKIYFLVIYLIILASNVSAIEINEIMYNPDVSDSYNEWIEIYNPYNTNINLSGWTICGDNILEGYVYHSDGLTYLNTTLLLEPNNYVIITDGGSGTDVYDNFIVENNSIALHIDGSTICDRGLGNDEDMIIIKDSLENIIDVVHYYSEWGANDNGRSLCKIKNLWKECTPTPGSDNENKSDVDYSLIEITEFLPDPQGDDNAPMPNGEWVELYNPTIKQIDLLGATLYDNTNKDIIITNTTTLYGTTIQPNGFLVIYINGKFGFLNNKGLEIIKFYDKNNNLIDELTYSDSSEAVSWAKISNIWQRATPSPGTENREEDLDFSSTLKIEKVYLGSDDKAKFGDNIRIKIFIYKANTSKYSVQLWIENDNGEKISKRTRVNIDDKFSNHTLTLPIQIEPNCNGKYEDGEYEIVIKGLDTQDKEEIEIEDITSSLCETVYKSKEISKKITFDIIETISEINAGQGFDTKVRINNNESKTNKFQIWSYAYRGSKSITGDREYNKQEITVPPQSSYIVNLLNTIKEGTNPGDYKFKIKIKKEGRKTPIEVTNSIKVLDNQLNNKQILGLDEITTGAILYEAGSIKAQRTAIFFFLFVLICLIVSLFWRKTL